MESAEVAENRVGLLAAAVAAGLAKSRGAARKLVQAKGLSVNGEVQDDPGRQLDFAEALHGRYYLLRRGKKHWRLLVRRPNGG